MNASDLISDQAWDVVAMIPCCVSPSGQLGGEGYIDILGYKVEEMLSQLVTGPRIY
jgi:hypothetical protein